MKINKSLLLAIVSTGAIATAAQAVVLETADFDTYSYVFLGNNNTSAETVNVSQYNGGGHFTFGVISFDTSGLSTSGDKYLSMQASEYSDGSQGATYFPTGTLTVNVGIMPASFQDYMDSPSDSGPPPPGTGKLPWFNANILGLTPIGQMTFVNQEVTSLDVTSAVNDWITGSTDNYGFVFWTTNPGDVRLVSSDASSGYAPALTTEAVPEPDLYSAIFGIAALGLVIRRRGRRA